MPSGIIMQSASTRGAETDEERQTALEKVFEANGLPLEKEEAAPGELSEPKREDFASEEEFREAQEAFEIAQEEAEEKGFEEEERKRLEALPKKSRKQRAIEKATKELQEENERLKKEIENAKSGKKPEAKVEEAKPPKREDFEAGEAGDKKFEEAVDDYKYKVRRAKEQKEEALKASEEHLKENIRNYTAAKDEIKKEYADWDDTMNEFGKLPISETAYMTILGLEEGPRVVYYLAKHPDQLERLNSLFPDSAVRELVRLHDRLKAKTKSGVEREAKPTTTPRKVIPEPVKPVATAAASSTLTSAEAAKKRDYRAFKVAQRAGR